MDLNLLAYFDALIAEGQVSRAAERVNLSQPAMSLALKRLRELFDDPLLVRTSNGMVPTSRARELIGPVREILRRSEDLQRPRGYFVPAEASASFTLISTDYVSLLLIPPLIFSMIWHERTHREPLYQWLRELVLQICATL